jgi:hypothetical protein
VLAEMAEIELLSWTQRRAKSDMANGVPAFFAGASLIRTVLVAGPNPFTATA